MFFHVYGANALLQWSMMLACSITFAMSLIGCIWPS